MSVSNMKFLLRIPKVKTELGRKVKTEKGRKSFKVLGTSPMLIAGNMEVRALIDMFE